MNLSSNGAHIVLLGDFELAVHGQRVKLPLGAERLLAFLAVQDAVTVPRMRVAEHLWPDTSPKRAAANVRSALSQGRQVADITIIDCDGQRIGLSPLVGVDLHEMHNQARKIHEGSCEISNPVREPLVAAFGHELLAAWPEDWLVLERQRWDQVRLHTLESMARQLRTAEHFLGAMQAALAAIAIAPFRETAHRIVIETHIAEGNPADAVEHYQRYRALLQREVGVAPSSRTAELVSELFPS